MIKGCFSIEEDGSYWFSCPGCRKAHRITVNSAREHNWTWNGDYDRPTISPSILTRWNYGSDNEQRVCHMFINDGKIQFLSDCTHSLAGQTVDVLPWSGYFMAE